MGLNFAVIKIRRLPPLRNLEISRGYNFANALLSDFLQISQIRNRNKQNTKRKHSKLLGTKEIRKVFHLSRCNMLRSTQR